MDFIKKAVSSSGGNHESSSNNSSNNNQQSDDYVDKGEWFIVLGVKRICADNALPQPSVQVSRSLATTSTATRRRR